MTISKRDIIFHHVYYKITYKNTTIIVIYSINFHPPTSSSSTPHHITPQFPSPRCGVTVVSLLPVTVVVFPGSLATSQRRLVRVVTTSPSRRGDLWREGRRCENRKVEVGWSDVFFFVL